MEALFREHEERYVFAGQYVLGKHVLDVACGTGVGTSYLRRAGARRVCGIDIDPGAVSFAKTKYKDCEFAQSDATSICLADSSIDVVVSFETLEHLQDQGKFLAECWRVLRPGGLLICSTPNTTVYRWQGSGINPYHVHELAPQEFTSLLKQRFSELCMFGQGGIVYPFYILRRVASRMLEAVGLRLIVRKILRVEAPPEGMRDEFSEAGNGVACQVRPYRRSRLRRPLYLIAVSRKV
jgi:ubiquinone/menaquinone biosynthesis C-methylase UbiE